MSDFARRLTRAPRAFDADRGRAAAEALGFDGQLAELVAGAAGSSPFLGRLIERETVWLAEALAGSPEAAFDSVVAELSAPEVGSGKALARALRVARGRIALIVALADLGGVWDLDAVTEALSRFADHALGLACDVAVAESGGVLAECADAASAGLVGLAMGKMGARELNYSSDIDLIFLFDDERWGDDAQEARAKLVQAVRRVVKLLSEQTADGYVFRTDLRLRPNPGATPVCISMTAAESYYESVGRTWERAAYIKARAAVGDIDAGSRFLDSIRPFVWRRHLDFAAIEDAHDMRLKIRQHKGFGRRLEVAGHDVKLGLGGIREIEFFAQTLQLVRGGRDPSLRSPRTREALRALRDATVIGAEDCAALDAHYVAHRTLEHRLQMIEDAQTQLIPASQESRERVAALGGWPDRTAFEREVRERCVDVRARCDALFEPDRHESAPTEPAALEKLGFQRPEAAAALLDKWQGGDLPATRSERARRRFARLTPLLLERLAAASSPDDAILAFDRFLSGLPAGVQIFALCEANPQLLDLICEICAAAPRLADYLGRHSSVLDAVLDRRFFEPLDHVDHLTDQLVAQLARAEDYERVLDSARRWAKERRFRAGVQVLRGVAAVEEAGIAFSSIAEACLRALFPHVVAEFARRHGPPPGRGAAIVALGKLGAREMTATSDLDLIVICDPADVEESDGRRPLPSALYYSRLTQMLIAALTAPTAEGALYAVDMRLRPSGRQGPVAVKLGAFRRYQLEDAWTWEHLALTRARVVAGDPALGEDAAAAIREALSASREAERTLAEVRAMRDRVAEANRARRAEPWELKHAEGGMMDISLAVQAGVLLCGLPAPCAPVAAARDLVGAGWLSAEDGEALAEAYALMAALQQVERVALDRPIEPEAAGQGLRAAMARTAGVERFEGIAPMLAEAQTRAAAAVERALSR